MFNRILFFLSFPQKKIDLLYHMIIAMSRMNHIHPEVLAQEIKNSQENANYMSEVTGLLGKK